MKPLLVAVALFFCTWSKANNYYFSSASGNDSYTPVQASSPSTPWQTLNKLNAILSTLKYGDSILFKRGEIFDGSIAVSASGSAAFPIVFTAYGKGTKPVINGFTTLAKWTLSNNNIYECINTSLLNSLNMVTINGVQQARGRYPNTDVNKGYLTFESHGTNSIVDDELSPAIDWTGAEVVIKPKRWILDRCTIISQKGTTISYTPSLTYNPYDNYGYFIQNHIKTLDLPGEWYYNSSAKKISVYSQPANFNASVIDVLVNIQYQSNIVFDNIVFSGANSKAMNLYYAQNVLVKNCDFIFSGMDGVFCASVNNISLVNNMFSNTNNNAINFYYNCNNNVIRNNVVKNTGLIPGAGQSGNGTYQGLFISGANNLVEYNIVDSTGFTAIRFGGGDSNVIKNNLVTNFTITKDDGGGITTLGTAGVTLYGQKVIGNIIRNGIGISEGTDKPGSSSSNGIYMDDNSSNVLIDGNTVTNCGKSGIFFHNAFKMTLTNNTVFDNATQLIMVHDYGMPNALLRNNVIKNNILFSKYESQVITNVSTMANDLNLIGTMDYNHYCRPLDDNLVTKASFIDNTGNRVDQILDLAGWQSTYQLDNASTKTPLQIPAYITTINTPNKFWNGNFNNNNAGLYSSSTGSWVNNKLDGGTFKATNTSATFSNYQVVIAAGSIDSSKNYVLRFSAQSMKDTIMNAYLRLSSAPYTRLSDIKVFKIITSRTENEFLFTLPSSAANASIIIETKCPLITFWLDNVELYEANTTITDPDDYILFEYNSSAVPKTVPLPGSYIDVSNKTYNNSIVLAPYSSAVLISKNVPTTSLPLTFLDFSGTLKNKTVDLEWKTTNETNTNYFEIERASDNVSYTSIGKVNAANIPGILTYNFADYDPAGSVNYYRLKQYDIDGKFTYSKVIHFQTFVKPGLSVSPNPAQTRINLQVSGVQSDKKISYYIFSSGGSLVKTGNEDQSTGQISVDITNLESGIYVLRAITETASYSKQFLKL
ncbi:MAG: right-handed parallel beta-helix repeat-containing protein [Ginsengibacter sp.]